MSLKKSGLFLIVFVFFICFSKAYVGVTPGAYTMNFEPGAERVFSFQFFGDEGDEFDIYADGDLAKYVTLSVDEMKGGGSVNVLLELPDEIKTPGSHVIYIGARDLSKREGIRLVSNIQGMIIINVPYPGKYATMTFNVDNANRGEDVKMKIELHNIGVDEVNFKGAINIYDERNKFLEKIDLGDYSMGTQSDQNIEYFFDTKPYISGKYNAEAVFEYESGTLIESRPFRLGQLMVEIKDATKKIYRDSINKFDVVVESDWNDPIENVYVVVTLVEHQLNFKTPSVTLNSFESANLTGYLDTTGITEDSFYANIRVFYGDTYSEKFVKVTFFKETNYLLIAGIVAGVIFIIIIIVLIVVAVKLGRIRNDIQGKKKKK